MARVSSHAGFGDTYLFDALVGRKGDGAPRLTGTLENFEFIAQTIGLKRDWLLSGEGPMWADEAEPAKAKRAAWAHGDDEAEDLLAVIEETLALFLRLPAAKAKACARSLADIAKNPPRGAGKIGRTDALRISVRAVLKALQDEAS